MQHGLRPISTTKRRQLKHSAAATSLARLVAAGCSRAVEITQFVEDESSSGIGTVCSTSKAINHALSPTTLSVWTQLIHRSASVLASAEGNAVEVASTVKNHAALRIRPVGPAGESVDRLFSPSISHQR